jgi:transcriptional regulator with PAS, ATPase and Fis domain
VEPGEGKKPVVKFVVARDSDGKPLRGPSELISHSVARSVLTGGGTVLSEDAGADDRFSDARSVTSLQLRSVLCAALEVKGRIAGAIYIDSTADRALFTQNDVATIELFSDLAALVLHNANLIDEVRKREQDLEKANNQVRELNQQLERRYLEQTAQIQAVEDDRKHLREQLTFRYSYDNIIGRGKKMEEVFRLLDRITDRPINVLILGENGTGKELIARALHYNSDRQTRRFESLNCAAIPEALVESELFGHKKGAFTDAHQDKKGVVELANQGTLFLDEIGDMPSTMQTKLLRVLADKAYRPVGATESRTADFRLITATNRDLAQMVSEGRFREDLLYRVNAVTVHLPPLRERTEDIPLLVNFFLQREAGRTKEPIRKMDQETLALLTRYDWPGNIRQLENEITRLVAISDDRIIADDLSPEIRSGVSRAESPTDPRLLPDTELTLKSQVETVVRTLVEEALRRSTGNKSHAARLLGLSRLGLRKKMERWSMSDSADDGSDDDAD